MIHNPRRLSQYGRTVTNINLCSIQGFPTARQNIMVSEMVVVMESEVLSALALPAINKVVVLAIWRLLISTNPKQAIMLNWRQ